MILAHAVDTFQNVTAKEPGCKRLKELAAVKQPDGGIDGSTCPYR